MAEEQRPSGLPISAPIQTDGRQGGGLDLAKLKNTLTKSSLWKANTLRRIEDARSAANSESENEVLLSLKRSLLQLVDQHWSAIARSTESAGERETQQEGLTAVAGDSEVDRQDLKMRNQYQGMRKALALQVKESAMARRRLQEQEKTLQARSREIARLQATIEQLQAENGQLSELHQSELNGQKSQLLDLQAAYDQFQHQADQLLDELDQENLRLRSHK